MAADTETQRYRLGGFLTAVEFHSHDVPLADLLAGDRRHSSQSVPQSPPQPPSTPPTPVPPASSPPAPVPPASSPPQSVYVIDGAVKLAHQLPDFECQYLIDGGESRKSIEDTQLLLQWLLDSRVQRDTTLCAIGGGVVSDLAAFVASIYQRGIALTLYPTTLLAMLDASFGGKTGINYGGYKNMVGSFYPAQRIVIAPQALTTLPDDELITGVAEAIKSAMLGDEQSVWPATPAAHGAYRPPRFIAIERGGSAGVGGKGAAGYRRLYRSRSAGAAEFGAHLCPCSGVRRSVCALEPRSGGGVGYCPCAAVGRCP